MHDRHGPMLEHGGIIMGLAKSIDLHCDRCSNWLVGGGMTDVTVRQLRSIARSYGWVRSGSQDICSECFTGTEVVAEDG